MFGGMMRTSCESSSCDHIFGDAALQFKAALAAREIEEFLDHVVHVPDGFVP